MVQSLTPLVYKLPKEVTCQRTSDSLVLVRSFPLKSIRLHSSWKAAFELLLEGHFVSLEKIVNCLKGVDSESIETFLNDLVRKGFLEQEGVSLITNFPFVSIIIPVRNRPEEIKACLQSLGKLDYPSGKFEIIVVDDASSDRTPDVIKEFNVCLISLKKNMQASFCRNLGAQKANGEILAFLDSDCVASPTWLTKLIPTFKDPVVGAVGGQVDSYFKTSALDKYEQTNSSLIVGTHAKRSKEKKDFFYVPSCNLLVTNHLFQKISGFSEGLVVGEDVDLCWRLQDTGYHVEFRPDGKIFHKHRNTIGPFCHRRFEYGTSEPLLQRLHKNRKKDFFLPVWGSLFWSVVIFSVVFLYPPLLFVSPFIVLADCVTKYIKVKQNRIPVKTFQLFLAIVRSYAALFYHCCAFVSRYYLLWSVPIILIFPFLFILFIVLHLISGLVDYFLKKPSLDLFGFLFFYSLEQFSYQAGVWFGCIKYQSFSAVNPVVIFQK